MLADIIKKYRKLSGYTQKQVAELVGVPLVTYQRWEMGHYNPSSKNLLKLHQVLNIPIDELSV